MIAVYKRSVHQHSFPLVQKSTIFDSESPDMGRWWAADEQMDLALLKQAMTRN